MRTAEHNWKQVEFIRVQPWQVLFLLMLSGCGQRVEVVPVAGRVTVAGEPLRDMVICFVSSSGHAASCPLASDGTFRLTSQYGKGIPAGEYRVTLAPDLSRSEVSMESTARRAPLPIAERYQYVGTSGLAFQVKAGAAPLEIEVEK